MSLKDLEERRLAKGTASGMFVGSAKLGQLADV
jgi:hypothetical protein